MTPAQELSSRRLIPTGDVGHLVDLGVELQHHASDRGIHNVFDDGGFKELLMLTLFDLTKLDREGDDAIDAQGRRYEMKTVARVNARGERKTSLAVTTEHTLTLANIARYRQVHLWIVAVFDQSSPEAIYEITPAALELYFSRWEQRLLGQAAARSEGSAPDHLNNPKIPLGHIQKHGTQVWPDPDLPLPEEVEAGLAEAEQLDDDPS
ncbi:MAG TPA: hypothetical protein VEW93_09295 [Acidimicrobiales bacterium]|nr:hypothetical protein [Acidimicrobiales bacterium]